jgi:predicted XRE-type DNA-binding protein
MRWRATAMAEISKIRRQLSDYEVEEQIRLQIMQEIERRSLDIRQVADALGMLPSGASLLMERRSWPLELGVRIARELGLRVEVKVVSKT